MKKATLIREKTDHKCDNCSHHLSIVAIPMTKEDTKYGTGSLEFYCQNCFAEYNYEVDLYVSEETYRKMNPEATEDEVQEYLEALNNLPEGAYEPYPTYRLDVEEEQTKTKSSV